MPKCCPRCPMYEGCDHRNECCPECDFYSDGECLFSEEEPYGDLDEEDRI